MFMNKENKEESIEKLYNMNDRALILKTTSNKLYSISAGNNPAKPFVVSIYNVETGNWNKIKETDDIGIEMFWETPCITYDYNNNLYIDKEALGEEKTNALIAKLKEIQKKVLGGGVAHIQTEEALKKAIKLIPTKINSIDELLAQEERDNPQGLNINPAKGEKIFFTSDIEGRLDWYLLFLIRIGALNRNKLSHEQWKVLDKCRQLRHVFMLNRQETDTLISIAQNLNDYLSDSFQGKILFNGDFISNRPTFAEKKEKCGEPVPDKAIDLWSNEERSHRSLALAEACYEMFKKLKNKYGEDRLILVAGNHDVVEFLQFDNGLQGIKQNILKEFNIKRYYKLKTDSGKTVIFKHAPWATQQQFTEILNNQNQNAPKALQNDDGLPINDDFCFYNCNFYDNKGRNKHYSQEYLLSNCESMPNNAINTNSLDQNHCFLIHGHTHEATIGTQYQNEQRNSNTNYSKKRT